MKQLNLILIGICMTLGGSLYGQDFTYTPKNPAFGGFYYNYQWLLQSAQIQDNTEDTESETSSSSSQRNALDDFEQSLNRQILSQLSREIVRNQFGEDALTEGTFNIGSYQMEVTEELGGLSVVILDVTTGDQTTLFIPYY